MRNWLQSKLVADTDKTGLSGDRSAFTIQSMATRQPLISVWMQTGRSHLSPGFPTTMMAGPGCCKLNQMVQPGGLTGAVNYILTEASVLPPPPLSSSSPTCQETGGREERENMPTSSASTGGLSEVAEVCSFDSISSHLKPND